jgi:hypothetical protein
VRLSLSTPVVGARSLRDNLETLYGAIADGALDVRLAKHQKQELEAYLDCGLLCRGFARLRCGACKESRLVAFSCKGRRPAAVASAPGRSCSPAPSASTCSHAPSATGE